MSDTTKVVAAGALVLVGGLLWWMLRDDAPESTAAASAVVGESTVPSEPVAPRPRPSADSTPEPEIAGPDVTATAKPGAAGDDLSPASACATDPGPECLYLDPDDDTLAQMARCGIVRYDYPRFLNQPDHPAAFDPKWEEEAEVTPKEREQLEAVARAFRSKLSADAVELAVEAGLERTWAEESPFFIVLGMVETRVEGGTYGESLLRVARERAGLDALPAPGAEPSLSDRAARLLTGAGDAFERAVAEALGPDRARELRGSSDGWSGIGRTLGNRCRVDEPAPPPPKSLPSTALQAQDCLEGWREGECGFLEVNDLLLDEMAKCGIVRYDFPTFLMTRDAEPMLDEAWSEAAGVGPAEAAVIAEVGEAFRERFYTDIVEMALEVGKTREWAEKTPLMGLMMALHDEVDDEGDVAEIFARIAKERAGQQAPSQTPSNDVHEAFVRRIAGLGDGFEVAMAERLGAQRAHQLREHADGWPDTRVQTGSQCKDEP